MMIGQYNIMDLYALVFLFQYLTFSPGLGDLTVTTLSRTSLRYGTCQPFNILHGDCSIDGMCALAHVFFLI